MDVVLHLQLGVLIDHPANWCLMFAFFCLFCQSQDVWRWWSWCHAEETQQQHGGHACRKVGTVCVTSSFLRLSNTRKSKLWNALLTLLDDRRVTSGPSRSSESSIVAFFKLHYVALWTSVSGWLELHKHDGPYWCYSGWLSTNAHFSAHLVNKYSNILPLKVTFRHFNWFACPNRSRSQTLGSDSSSLDEGGVFDCLKPDSPSSPQQLFSGLVGVPSSSVTSVQFQAAAGLALGSTPPEILIQMASTREEGGPHCTEGVPFLPRPSQHHQHLHHHHHHQHLHHHPLQHRTSSLLQQERRSSREEGQEEVSTPSPALSELKAVVTWLQRGFPFILILLAKVCFQHKLGKTF